MKIKYLSYSFNKNFLPLFYKDLCKNPKSIPPVNYIKR